MTIEPNLSPNFIKANNASHMWHPMGDPMASKADPALMVAGGDDVFAFAAGATRLALQRHSWPACTFIDFR